MTSRRVVVFRLDSQAYGLPISDVREILPFAQLTRPPGMPELLAGFLNLSGTAIPVVRLARLFNQTEREPDLYTPLLLLSDRSGSVALLVDAVDGIITLSDADLVPVREQFSFNNCAECLATLGAAHVVVLDTARLLLEQQRACIAEMRAAEQLQLDALREVPA